MRPFYKASAFLSFGQCVLNAAVLVGLSKCLDTLTVNKNLSENSTRFLISIHPDKKNKILRSLGRDIKT